MKLHKKTIIISSIICLAVVVSAVILTRVKTRNADNQLSVMENQSDYEKKFEALLEYLKYYKIISTIDRNSNSVMPEILTESEAEKIKETADAEKLAELYLILSMQKNEEGRLEEKSQYIKMAEELIPEIKNTDLTAFIYAQCSIDTIEDYDKSTEYFKKAEEIVRKTGKKKMLLWLYYMRGIVCVSYIYPLEETNEILGKALNYAFELNDKNAVINIYYLYSLEYWYANQQIVSTSYKLEAYKLANVEKKDYKKDFLAVEIGVDFLELGNPIQSLSYLTPVILNETDYYDKNFLKAYACCNAFNAYMNLDRIDDAEEAVMLFKNYTKKMRDEPIKEHNFIFFNLLKGQLELKNGNPEKAEEYLMNFISQFEPIKSAFMYYDAEKDAEILKGDIAFFKKEYKKAENFYESILIGGEEITKYYQMRLNEKISQCHKEMNEYKEAFKYAEKNSNMLKENSIQSTSQYTEYMLQHAINEDNEKRINSLLYTSKVFFTIILGSMAIAIPVTIETIILLNRNKKLRRLTMQQKNISYRDGLTEVLNRRALDDYLKDRKNELFKRNKYTAFVLLDVDFFKKYNDNYGHIKGDMVLKRLAGVLKESCREDDFVVRYGGEEFLLILNNTNEKAAESILKNIRKNLEKIGIEHKYSEVSDRITISIGTALVLTKNIKNNDDLKLAIEKADEALYEAKKERNTFIIKRIDNITA